MPTKAEIAARLREARTAKSKAEGTYVSQEAVAKALNTTRNVVIRWEKAQHAPNREHALALARYFKTAPDHFLFDRAAQVAEQAALVAEVAALAGRVAAIEAQLRDPPHEPSARPVSPGGEL